MRNSPLEADVKIYGTTEIGAAKVDLMPFVKKINTMKKKTICRQAVRKLNLVGANFHE